MYTLRKFSVYQGEPEHGLESLWGFTVFMPHSDK